MSEQNKPFVVTDRRKFTLDGELRPDADPSPAKEPRVVATPEPPAPLASPQAAVENTAPEEPQPAGPTADQSDQARAAYQATSDRLDTAIRAANPGVDHPPTMSFEQLIQSFYMTAVVQLGGSTPEGQPPQVDLISARQSIDLLAILEQKTKGNLTPDESRLIESALFELRMAFLEVTQAIARSAAARNAPGSGPGRPNPNGPSIVR